MNKKMGITGRISTQQEDALKAAIVKAVGSRMMIRFPHVVYAMECWDPATGDEISTH